MYVQCTYISILVCTMYIWGWVYFFFLNEFSTFSLVVAVVVIVVIVVVAVVVVVVVAPAIISAM